MRVLFELTRSALRNSSKSSVPLPSVSHASNALLYSWCVEDKACNKMGIKDAHEAKWEGDAEGKQEHTEREPSE